jgi:hypothetical protein
MCQMFLASSYVDLYVRFDVLTGVNVKFVLFLVGASYSLMGRCVRTYTASHSIRNLHSVDYSPKLLISSPLVMNCFLKVPPLHLK